VDSVGSEDLGLDWNDGEKGEEKECKSAADHRTSLE
jgi:hypothetical protein